MSYILDALRRADAERERGAVPGLQSQQHAIADDDAGRPDRARSLWAVVALAVALVAVLAWAFLGAAPRRRRARRSRARSGAGAGALAGAVSAADAAGAGTATTLTSGTATGADRHRHRAADRATDRHAAPPPAARLPPALTDTGVALRRAPAVAAAPPAGRAGAGAIARRGQPAPAPQRVADAARDRDRGTAPATADAARVYAQAELPEEIRRDLPKIVVGGSSYSSDAASRMVMVNGQVFHEGDRLAPDLVLERIRQKSAVLSFKGWQYEVVF